MDTILEYILHSLKYISLKMIKIIISALVMLFALSATAQKQYRLPYPEPCAEPDIPGKPAKQLSEKKFGYFNLTEDDGEFVLILNYGYDEANLFSKITGYATVRIGDHWGIINIDGAPLVPFIYDKIMGPNEGGYYMMNLEGKWGVLDKSGQMTVTCKFETMDDLFNGWYEVSDGEKWGYVHWSGVYAASYQEYEKKREALDK